MMKIKVTDIGSKMHLVAGTLKLAKDDDGKFPVEINDRSPDLLAQFIEFEPSQSKDPRLVARDRKAAQQKAGIKTTELCTKLLNEYLSPIIIESDKKLNGLAYKPVELNRNRKTGKVSFIRLYKPAGQITDDDRNDWVLP